MHKVFQCPTSQAIKELSEQPLAELRYVQKHTPIYEGAAFNLNALQALSYF